MGEQTRDPVELWVALDEEGEVWDVSPNDTSEREEKLNREKEQDGSIFGPRHVTAYVPTSELEAARVRIGLLLARIEHLESQK